MANTFGIDNPTEYEFVNSKCSAQQLSWQNNVVTKLAFLDAVFVNRLNRFQHDLNGKTLDEDVVIVMMAEWLKLFDSLMLLVKYGKFDVAQIVVRTMLELGSQISFLLMDDRETKAAYYCVCQVFQCCHMNMGLSKYKKIYTSEELEAALQNQMDDLYISDYSKMVEIAEKVCPDHKYSAKNIGTKWYLLYAQKEQKCLELGKGNITDLIDYIAKYRDKEKSFINTEVIYDYLSKATHGLLTIKNSNYINNHQYFRSYECLNNAPLVLIMLVKLIELLYISFYQAYNEKFDRIEVLQEEINQMEHELGKCLEELKTLQNETTAI